MAQLTATEERVRGRVRNWYDRVNARWCYLFLIPAVITTGLFTIYPMIMSWVYSFMDWNGFTDDVRPIGFDNYIELASDEFFWNAFGRSLLFVLVGTPLRVIGSLVVAIVLNRQIMKLSSAFRTMFFLPVMVSASIIGVVMGFVLSPNNGPINAGLRIAGITDQPIEFLSDPQLALWSVILVQTWKSFGTTMIWWLAALQTVPQEYYEAARVDGASGWKITRYITMPILIPFAVIIIVLTIQNNLHAFALVQTMTAGGPYFASETLEVYIYRTAFQPDAGGLPRLGYASAAGCFFGTVTLIFALVQFWAIRLIGDNRKELQAAKAAEA